MIIKTKEAIYINADNQERVVPAGTTGVERNKLVYFYDVTKTFSVAFSREFCVETPAMFSVHRVLADKEVMFRDVAEAIQSADFITSEQKAKLTNVIETL